MSFTHFDKYGRAKMVDIEQKPITRREAVAHGSIFMQKSTLELIKNGQAKKGDVLGTAQIAGIMAAKNTSGIIPMCHNICLEGVNINYVIDEPGNKIDISATVITTGKTGAEMESLTAVSVCALTIYDMCKAHDKTMSISDICLVKKSGGKSDLSLGEDIFNG